MGVVGVVRGVEREGVMRGGVEKKVVADCWGWSVWKGRVRVEGRYRLREVIATIRNERPV